MILQQNKFYFQFHIFLSNIALPSFSEYRPPFPPRAISTKILKKIVFSLYLPSRLSQVKRWHNTRHWERISRSVYHRSSKSASALINLFVWSWCQELFPTFSLVYQRFRLWSRFPHSQRVFHELSGSKRWLHELWFLEFFLPLKDRKDAVSLLYLQ